MNVSPAKRAYLVEILGEEEAVKILDAAQQLTKALEDEGVAYKVEEFDPIVQDILAIRGTNLTVSDEVADWFEEGLKEHKDPAALHVLDLLRGRAVTQR